VNTVSGAMNIFNNTGGDSTFNYYEIRSPSGLLDNTWSGLDSQDGSDVLAGWTRAGGSNPNLLAETNFLGSSTFSDQQIVSIGNGYNEQSVGDPTEITFWYDAGPTFAGLQQGAVTFVTTMGLPGDYNMDNVVDLADYTVWRNNLGAASIPNEGASPGIVDAADYTFWKSQFGATISGLSGISAAAVPEPGAIAIALCGCLVIIGLRRQG